ncbi:uncharacterized protein HKW66_Vig0042400 [Vigna angularis]|uniref:Uncharacterized protein n=1 Tax=Phaseolus angularis TaxID=3914 RepID=A0A8T0L4S0_PHAAN|nr:uncharacterized protein HKW66_Vig0042400 [Vigna angularis]
MVCVVGFEWIREEGEPKGGALAKVAVVDGAGLTTLVFLPQYVVVAATMFVLSENEHWEACRNGSSVFVSAKNEANVENEVVEDNEYDDSLKKDELETLSDIDDCDVDVYHHDEDEKNIKKMLWERVNRMNKQSS